jgi:hypothetical protein
MADHARRFCLFPCSHIYMSLSLAGPHKRSKRTPALQCGLSRNDFSNYFNAERIRGGPEERPCAVATVEEPAADHAGEMVAGLAAAAAMFRDLEPSLAAQWLEAAQAVYSWARQHPGLASDWFDDVCSSTLMEGPPEGP